MTGPSGRGVGPAEHAQRESRAEDRTDAAARVREFAETWLYDGDTDQPRTGYEAALDLADALAAADAVDRANCPDCGHEHASESLAGICVGCPCETRGYGTLRAELAEARREAQQEAAEAATLRARMADGVDRAAGRVTIDTRNETLVERIATALGEKHSPGYPAWRRNHPRTPGVPSFEDGEYVDIPSEGANASTMLVFRADDGHNAMRPLTWREVTAAVIAALAPEAHSVDVVDDSDPEETAPTAPDLMAPLRASMDASKRRREEAHDGQ